MLETAVRSARELYPESWTCLLWEDAVNYCLGHRGNNRDSADVQFVARKQHSGLSQAGKYKPLLLFFSQLPATPSFSRPSRHSTLNLRLFPNFFMKSLRKSLNGYKDQSHHISSPVSPLPPLSKPIAATQPPKKVIRALQSHRASAPQELSFEKGDFFHVVNDVGSGFWYEAHNPMTGARGLVPRNMFEVFGKGGAM